MAFKLHSPLSIIWEFLRNEKCWSLVQIWEKEMVTHSSTLAWKIPWTQEPGRLQSMGSRRVRHDWATSLSLFTFLHWRRKWQPAPVILPGESQGRRSQWAAVYGVAQSWTWLKWLSSSSSPDLQVRNSGGGAQEFCYNRFFSYSWWTVRLRMALCHTGSHDFTL